MAVRQKKLLKWISQELSSLLGMEVTSDEDGIAYFITSMQSKVDLEDYLTSILDSRQTEHRKFIEELLQRWAPNPKATISLDNVNVDPKVTNKQPKPSKSLGKLESRTHSPNLRSAIRNERSKSPQVKVIANNSGSGTVTNVSQTKTSSNSKDMSISETKPFQETVTKPKTKTVFKPLFTTDGKDRSVIQIPGRHSCICQASKHKLVNNCLRCGRVVCEQEGAGPCFFCGNLVCSAQDLALINSKSSAGKKRLEQLMQGSDVPKSFQKTIKSEDNEAKEKAVEHKNKLLNYDQTSARRTKVIDDEADYFNTDSRWLSDKEREALDMRKQELHERKHASRLDKKMTFDFAGRRVVEEGVDVNYEAEFKDVTKQMTKIEKKKLKEITNKLSGGISHPSAIRPKFVAPDAECQTENVTETSRNSGKSETGDNQDRVAKKAAFLKSRGLRLQDRELKRVVDQGMCMSMHQPWASLLVAGVKMHEGRSWYSAHRGRLWIASTVKEPTVSEIEDWEQFYILHYNCKDRSEIPWPSNYPTACLLGCVDVADVLAQEEYRTQFRDGESNSPYIFICENPRELKLKFPIKGDHKIYNLDPMVHKSSKTALYS